jgi:hypothetical protein
MSQGGLIGVFNPISVISLVAFGAVGASLGWRRGTKAIYRRSVSEANLAPGETRRNHERRLRRRRKVGRVIATLFYCLVGLAAGLLFVSATGLRR